jgi:hypothetical protein
MHATARTFRAAYIVNFNLSVAWFHSSNVMHFIPLLCSFAAVGTVLFIDRTCLISHADLSELTRDVSFWLLASEGSNRPERGTKLPFFASNTKMFYCILLRKAIECTFSRYNEWLRTRGRMSQSSIPGEARIFTSSYHLDRLCGPASLLYSLYLGSFLGLKPAVAWSWSLVSNYCRSQENMDSYIHSRYAFMAYCLIN